MHVLICTKYQQTPNLMWSTEFGLETHYCCNRRWNLSWHPLSYIIIIITQLIILWFFGMKISNATLRQVDGSLLHRRNHSASYESRSLVRETKLLNSPSAEFLFKLQSMRFIQIKYLIQWQKRTALRKAAKEQKPLPLLRNNPWLSAKETAQ